MSDIWNEALKGLQPRLGSETYELWLRPLTVAAIEGRRLKLRAPSLFMKEWFENHYREAVLEEIFARTSERYEIELEVDPSAASQDAATSTSTPTPDAPQAERVEVVGTKAPPPVGLSERYRFDTFIKGASNELAASAATAVAEEPGRRFNPLLIYGGVGLGKTHLLHAVGHRTLRAPTVDDGSSTSAPSAS